MDYSARAEESGLEELSIVMLCHKPAFAAKGTTLNLVLLAARSCCRRCPNGLIDVRRYDPAKQSERKKCEMSCINEGQAAGFKRVTPRSGVKILLVEDDCPALEILSLFLKRFYPVIACSSGASALRELESNPDIGLILTDLRMPGASGYDVLRSALQYSRRTGKSVPAIVLTGHGTLEDEQQARSLGARCFQRKPIDLPQLLRTIEKCLAAGKAEYGQEERAV